MTPDNLKYTKEHEWVKIDGGIATVGITDYAQHELGDIVYVELPKIGLKVVQMKPFGTIEAVKAISDIFSPISGEVTEVNSGLESDASVINTDPYGKGWIMKLKIANSTELNSLLSPSDYKAMIGE